MLTVKSKYISYYLVWRHRDVSPDISTISRLVFCDTGRTHNLSIDRIVTVSSKNKEHSYLPIASTLILAHRKLHLLLFYLPIVIDYVAYHRLS